MKGLLIAEKPSLKRTIEAVYNKHRDEIPYELKFMDQRGHLFTLKNPNEMDEELKDWSWDTLPIHPENYGGWTYKPIEDKKVGNFLTAKERYAAISKELKENHYDFIVNAGDPDQEGELLIRIVLDLALKNKLPVKRYWSNDTTEPKVLDALQNLKDDDNDPMLKNLLAAAYGRQHSDWRFGMNVSRAATLRMGARAACGRVKTPILSIVCARENEIRNFRPTTCYGVKSNYEDGFSGQMYEPTGSTSEEESNEKEEDAAEKGMVYFDTKEEAEACIASLSNDGRVIKFEKKRVETLPPKLFKLATLQIEAGKHGYSSQQTLEIIQGLYDKGYLSYPRTDCEYISSNENLRAFINSAAKVPSLESFAESIDNSAIGKVKATKKWVNDKKLTESGHSALVPTIKHPNYDEFNEDEKKMYEIVCRRFLSIFLPPLVQNKTMLLVQVDDRVFKSNGKTLIDAGYTRIYGSTINDVDMPEYEEGEPIMVEKYEIAEKTTKCPSRFTDADLIAACENPKKYLNDERLKQITKELKIGTPATRASIIEELIQRDKYLKREKEKKTEYIVPTETGEGIYENLKDFSICKVDMTAEWEEKLEKVRMGEMSLDELEDIMKKDVETLVNEIKNASMTSLSQRSAVITTCPKCGGDIKEGKTGFYCTGYKENGCTIGTYGKICDSKIKGSEFASLLAGEEIVKNIKKGDKTWDQKLKYNFDTCKIEFVKSEYTPSEKKESDYSCPNCGNSMMEDDRVIKCDCGFSFWKTTCGVKLTDEQIRNFFENEETGIIKGLTSKAGKKFDANIVLNDERTG
nr:topoisomerase C-terminal repeat-containing protein [Lachnospiraceae bacterium]